jgi:4-hydroxy 2-oxovalerate aldolase
VNHVKVLDCTLRDGAYLVDKTFGDKVIRGMIQGLVESRIDWIEIGFLQKDGTGDGKTVYQNAAQARKFIPEDKGVSRFCVLADYSRYDIYLLEEYDGTSFDTVRVCFFKNERYDALEFARQAKKKGYGVFIQPVDVLGYTDGELLDYLDQVNELEPDCFSIVDTFGSMYEEDLRRVYSLIDHNLMKHISVGFHSHNNMQLSNALSQSFIKMTFGSRNGVIDATVTGMGRGAGNTPTELILQYLIRKWGYSYHLDPILDVSDWYMDVLRTRCEWGYNLPYFLAGCYGAHVNNIAYLLDKGTIESKDMRFILNKLGTAERKRYDYKKLDEIYLSYMDSRKDDRQDMKRLEQIFSGKPVLIVLPGASIVQEREKICEYQKKTKGLITVAVHLIPYGISSDYVYVSNPGRYRQLKQDERFETMRKIMTSNLPVQPEEGDFIISFRRLIKCGWLHADNSALMLLRLLDQLGVSSIALAGLDGYTHQAAATFNYADRDLERNENNINAMELNEEIGSMLRDFLATRQNYCPVEFITHSRFDRIFSENTASRIKEQEL